MPATLMKCGHMSNATQSTRPVCVICLGIEEGADVPEEVAPDLTGRTAYCIECTATAPSSFELAFFEYLPNAVGDRYYSGCHGWS